MMLVAALLVLAQGAQPAPAPDSALGIRCIYDTVGMDRMQSYNAQIEARTLTVQQYAEATAADRKTCAQRRIWKTQKQVDVAFGFSLSMAAFVAAGKDLQAGGINPDDVLGRWDTLPTPLRAAMKAGVGTYPGGEDKFVQDVRAYLVAHTPAKTAPYLGHALGLYMSYGDMLRAQDEYLAAGTAPQP